MAEIDDLQRLTEMRDRSDISPEEYEKLKAKLLDDQPSTPQPARQEGARADEIKGQTRWWLIGTGALMVIGSVLPWAQSGIFSAAGTEGDGIITLIAGVVVALIGIANRASYATGIGALVMGGLSVWVVVNIFGNIDLELAGTGVYLTFLASLFAAIAGLQLLGEVRKRA